MLYQWLLVLHLLSLISWMAALFYLPRLFVYHVESGLQSPQAQTFQVMERRLLRGIATPAMVATWIFGLWLAAQGGWFAAGWLHAKILLVILMSAFHGVCVRWMRDLAAGKSAHSARFFRIVNEVPTVLLILIVILVVIKPF
jgi:putative membrane protein